MADTDRSTQAPAENGTEKPSWGAVLAIWMALTVLLNAVIWVTGVKDHALASAVERGAARVEEKHKSEESEDVIRKDIELQRDTLRFWTVVALLGDFLIAPLSLGMRALFVAVAFSAVAAVFGRTVRYQVFLADCIRWQGVWVLGLATQVVLMVMLWTPNVETSVVLLLPPGVYEASRWVMLKQIDCFALFGWLGMAWSASWRGQSNLFVALFVCLVLWSAEIMLWASASLVVNLSMRLSLMPR